MVADFSTWIPKIDVATSLSNAERRSDRKVKKRRLWGAQCDVPGGRPIIVLYPEDAEKPKVHLVPPVPVELDQKTGTQEAVRSALPPAARDLVATVLETTPYLPRPLFLSLREASEDSGLSQAYLRRLIPQKELPAIESNDYRISKNALEWRADRSLPKQKAAQ